MSDPDSKPAVGFHPAAAGRPLTFGPFRFDRVDRTLVRDDEEIHLPPRILAVLEYLLERAGRVVSKQALLDAVWKDANVSESSLTEAIGQLRQVLGDSTQEPAYVQTVHRRGYRFIAPVVIAPVPQATPLALVPGTVAARSRGAFSARPVILVALLAAVALLGWWATARRSAEPAVSRTTISLPAGQAPAPGLTAHPVAALSPDASRLIYVAGTTGKYQLFERAIDQFEAAPIPGTEGAHGVFFSPDGASIGYFADGWLHTMPLATRQSLRLAEAGSALGGTWLGRDAIVVATGDARGLIRVGLRDGAVKSLPVEDPQGPRMRFPQALPNGRTIVATEWRGTPRESVVVAVDAVTGRVEELGAGVFARWAPPGWLAFLKRDTLMVRPFPGQGPAVPVLSGVMSSLTGAAQFALSENGSLVYVPAEPERGYRDLVRIVDGRLERLPFEPRAFQSVIVSPDGRHLAATILGDEASDLWIGDMARGTITRVTSEGGSSLDPVWSPDGQWVLFGRRREGKLGIFRTTPDAVAPPELVVEIGASPSSMAPDGTLLVQRPHPARGIDLQVIRPGASTAEDWLATPAFEFYGRFSPDGRWVVFQSERSGRREVYLRSFADRSFGELQVSPAGGRDPHWTAGGRSIVYMERGQVFEVSFAEGRLSPARLVFEAPDLIFVRPAGPGALIGVRRRQEQQPITTLRLVSGWLREVNARLGR